MIAVNDINRHHASTSDRIDRWRFCLVALSTARGASLTLIHILLFRAFLRRALLSKYDVGYNDSPTIAVGLSDTLTKIHNVSDYTNRPHLSMAFTFVAVTHCNSPRLNDDVNMLSGEGVPRSDFFVRRLHCLIFRLELLHDFSPVGCFFGNENGRVGWDFTICAHGAAIVDPGCFIAALIV